jgi:TPR repeat protein
MKITNEIRTRWKQHLSTFWFVAAFAVLPTRSYSQNTTSQPAINQLGVKADSGDAEAMYELAMHYQSARLVGLDLTKAREWLERAADAGSAPAADRLGYMYMGGDGGVAVDYSIAFLCFQKEADSGAALGMLALGNAYENGQGTATDFDQAARLYAQAFAIAKQRLKSGDPAAMHAVAWIYFDGLGVDKDYTQSLKFYVEAATAGDTQATLWIGYFFEKGLGVPVNFTEAMNWYRKAADAGNTDALNRIAHFYKVGLGVDHDDEKAIGVYRKAVDFGSSLAMRNIAYVYSHPSTGIKPNFDEAMNWYRRAADLGQVAAMDGIGNLFEIEKKLDEARIWYRKAADAGDKDAIKWLSMHGSDRFLILGSGFSREKTAVSTERDIAFVADSLGANAKPDILFCDGNTKAEVVRIKGPLPPDQQVVADLFLAPDADRTTSTYRAPNLRVRFRPDSRDALEQLFGDINGSMGLGDRLIVFATGHGGRPEDRMQNSSLSLWGEPSISVDEFSDLLGGATRKERVVLIMNQCFGGGFADLIFDPPKNRMKLADPCLCGFFATPADEPASGCTSDPNSPEYEDYSSYFFAAIFGKTYDGKPVPLQDVDFDGDGKVSMREAHAYAMIHANNEDLPVTTSDVFLRRFSKTRDVRNASMVLPSASKTGLLNLATPDQKAVIDALLRLLNLPGNNVESEALGYEDKVASEIDHEIRDNSGLADEFLKLKKEIQDHVKASALSPMNQTPPDSMEDIEDLAKSGQLPRIAEAIRKTKNFARMNVLMAQIEGKRAKLEAMRRDATKARRLLYVVESVSLRANLETVLKADYDDASAKYYLQRFNQLFDAENESLDGTVAQ